MSDNQPVINVEHIAKYFEIYDKPAHRLWQMLCRGRKQFFKPYWALSDISFTVNKGECVGILGRNGAGKSTLLQIITGTLAPSSGAVAVRGRVAALLELGSGFNPEFTGKENVYLNATILGLTKAEIDARYNDIINFADIGDFIAQPVKTYSSGMVLRLAFSVIAHVDADVLIIDEALAVGDAFFSQKCMRFLRSFLKEKTILFVSHDIAAINALCNRAILLENGCVKKSGEPKSVIEEYMKDMYESVQGKSNIDISRETPAEKVFDICDDDYHDMRQDFINTTDLRNDIHIFRFMSDGESFGKGGCTIDQVFITNTKNEPLTWVVGGEKVILRIYCTAHEELFSPIIGFHFKEKTGLVLFGDNTYLSYKDSPLHVEKNKVFCATFTFRMPVLEAGDYFIGTAVAEGSQTEHVQHQWRHESLMLTSTSSSLCTGLMGIPMTNISLRLTK